jgi:hypothetical protein
MSERDLITFAKAWKEAEGQFSPKDFVSKPEPCGNPRLFLPVPEVTTPLLESEEREEANSALMDCTGIVGTWGDRISMKDSEEFVEASKRFENITGVSAWDVIEEAREQLINKHREW